MQLRELQPVLKQLDARDLSREPIKLILHLKVSLKISDNYLV